MFGTVTLPIWLLVLILAFAAVTFASHFLFPSVRWFFRRRMERVVAKLNQRLERPIEPFKLLRRQDTIQRLVYDPKVMEAVSEYAARSGVREDVAFEKARGYAREIVPSFSATAYFGFAIRLMRFLSRAFYEVRLSYLDEQAISKIDPNATVVFIMNHRSNMDYILVPYLVGERSALSFAAGEWARVWPLSALVRALGAYFIRRRSLNDFYRKIMGRYVQMVTANGVTQAVFPEGGLSLDGRVGAPKLGIMSYLVSEFEHHQTRDIVFVPVALNYDRVLEDRVLVAAADKDERKFRLQWRYVLRHVAKHLWQRMTGRFLGYGYAAVTFGLPISLAAYSKTTDDNLTEAIANEVMSRIRGQVPALPVPLLSRCLLQAEEPITQEALRQAFTEQVELVKKSGGMVRLPRDDVEFALRQSTNHLQLRNIISEEDGIFSVTPRKRNLLTYYANSIEHLFSAGA